MPNFIPRRVAVLQCCADHHERGYGIDAVVRGFTERYGKATPIRALADRRHILAADIREMPEGPKRRRFILALDKMTDRQTVLTIREGMAAERAARLADGYPPLMAANGVPAAYEVVR